MNNIGKSRSRKSISAKPKLQYCSLGQLNGAFDPSIIDIDSCDAPGIYSLFIYLLLQPCKASIFKYTIINCLIYLRYSYCFNKFIYSCCLYCYVQIFHNYHPLYSLFFTTIIHLDFFLKI